MSETVSRPQVADLVPGRRRSRRPIVVVVVVVVVVVGGEDATPQVVSA